jgi:uncharacterized membrane protein
MTTTAPAHHTATAPDDGGGRSGGAAGAGRAFSWVVILAGAAGLLAAWVISVDEYKLLMGKITGHTFTPGCSFNPIVSCGSVMESDQATVFGPPNPFIGLFAYAVVLCVGVSLLTGARFPRWYCLTFNAGCLFGVVFVTWLQYQSLYSIHALCLWCCLAWVATIFAFWYVTGYNIKQGFLPAPTGLREAITEFHWVVPVLHVGVIGMLVLTNWWSFWTS